MIALLLTGVLSGCYSPAEQETIRRAWAERDAERAQECQRVACHSWLATAAVTEEVHEMSAGGVRWLVTCSCGWTRECSSRWAAESVTKLHPKLAEVGIEHAVRIENPPAAGQQLQLT